MKIFNLNDFVKESAGAPLSMRTPDRFNSDPLAQKRPNNILDYQYDKEMIALENEISEITADNDSIDCIIGTNETEYFEIEINGGIIFAVFGSGNLNSAQEKALKYRLGIHEVPQSDGEIFASFDKNDAIRFIEKIINKKYGNESNGLIDAFDFEVMDSSNQIETKSLFVHYNAVYVGDGELDTYRFDLPEAYEKMPYVKGCAAFFQDLVNYIYDEYIKELEKIAR